MRRWRAAPREIGTLRVLGFSRGSILFSFFVESVLLAGLGGILGCLLVLPLNGVTTGIGSTTFSELAFNFRVTPADHAGGRRLRRWSWEHSADCSRRAWPREKRS